MSKNILQRLDSLPCASCEIPVKKEQVKGKFSVWSAIINGIAIVIAAIAAYLATKK